MKSGHYIVVRFNPDPARNEVRNVGILLWDQAGYQLHVDGEAIHKVVRENPHLHATALDWIEEALASGMKSCLFDPDPRSVSALVDGMRRLQLDFTEPLFTTIEPNMKQTLRVLVNRIVKPRNRPIQKAVEPVRALAKRLKPLILDKLVEPKYEFKISASGIARTVDFFANSTANVALEAVQFNLKTNADGIISRADAQANKVRDIQEANPGVRFLLYCSLSEHASLKEANYHALSVLRASSAVVETTLATAVSRFERTIKRPVVN